MSTESGVSKVDLSNLYTHYEKWPLYFVEASKINTKADHEADYYNNVVFCGMGGSATSCDILNDLMSYGSNVHSIVIRGQKMPASVDNHSLVIANSASGNTEETLTMVKEASNRKAEVICITSGGNLKDLAIGLGCNIVQIPRIAFPRVSLPYLLLPGLKIIQSFLLPQFKIDITSVYDNVDRLKGEILAHVPEKDNISKRIAIFLNSGFAFCFTSPYLLSSATRFKNSLNENAKVHCLKESILEASHNEIVPFTYNSEDNPRVLLLNWARDDQLIKSRFRKVGRLFSTIGQPVFELTITEEDMLSAIISSIYILDLATVYMALNRKIDPSLTPAIEILKRD